MMSFAKPLQEKLFGEMKARIKEKDESVPVCKNGYYYYTRTEEGKQYLKYCRKKENLQASEEILLDVDELPNRTLIIPPQDLMEARITNYLHSVWIRFPGVNTPFISKILKPVKFLRRITDTDGGSVGLLTTEPFLYGKQPRYFIV